MRKKDCANFGRLGSWVAVAGGAKGDARWVRSETDTRSSDGQLLNNEAFVLPLFCMDFPLVFRFTYFFMLFVQEYFTSKHVT